MNIGACFGSSRVQKGTTYQQVQKMSRKVRNGLSTEILNWRLFCDICKVGVQMDPPTESSFWGTLFLRLCRCVAKREWEYRFVFIVSNTHHTCLHKMCFYIVFLLFPGLCLKAFSLILCTFGCPFWSVVFVHFRGEPSNSDKQRVTAGVGGWGP